MASWQEKAKAKRESVLNSIPKEWILDTIPTPEECPNANVFLDNYLPDEENSITHSTALGLVNKILNKELTSYEITKAFCHRTAILHQLTNCCSEIFFEKAYKKANELDQYFTETGKLIGKFHGIPVSLKDQFNLEGIDSAIGYISLLNKPKKLEDTSKLAIILENAGCIFFCKSTTPMAMMADVTNSNIYGETVNSINRKLSCGGSSGGEGAIVGGRGALIGFGTDIGGSIRTPSAFQGIYGLRGSSNRLPYCKISNSFEFQPVLSSVVGPMCQDLKDLKEITKLIIDSKPWLVDPRVPPIEWRESSLASQGKLSFGVMKWNKINHPHPPVVRTMELVVESLKAKGHEVIEWDPPVSTVELAQVAFDVFGSDGYEEVVEMCAQSGEPIVPEILSIAKESDLPKGCDNLHDHWDQARRRYEYQQIIDNYWQETANRTSTGRPIDGLITPVWDCCSFKTKDVSNYIGDYVAPINVLDYTVCIAPVTKVDKKIDVVDNSFEFLSAQDKKIHDLYDPELYDGTPSGVQVIAPRYQEETAIELCEIVMECCTGN
ncbi:unnamed protein product [[Candida] boidinii]|uniref:amidase n=1 Tax=Candida boidinii TaxID=5477 RepID=A0A9W6SVN0_CANBO|nr:hypothetical protein B5S30_g1513 [[Candida] boidinii]OWB84541.1 hypothetical protein B5S33_g3189 [[Candida] boidinii]GME67568.1 unnamed protein product [[Candida] boidinii]